MLAYEEESNPEASAEFQSTLEQDSEFMDNVIDKVSQLKVLKEEIEKKRRELDTNHTQNLKQRLTAVRPAQTYIPTYSGNVFKVTGYP